MFQRLRNSVSRGPNSTSGLTCGRPTGHLPTSTSRMAREVAKTLTLAATKTRYESLGVEPVGPGHRRAQKPPRQRNKAFVNSDPGQQDQHRLSSLFQKFTHVFLDGELQGLTLRPAIPHARDQGIEVGSGELPFEWMGDALEIALEVGQPLSDRIQAREVVGVSTLRCTIEK